MVKTELYNTVIKNDYCIGCGACAFVNPNYSINMDEFGMLKAEVDSSAIESEGISLASKVCPFSNDSKNEDYLSNKHFPQLENKDPYLGKYIKNYVGYVEEGDFRNAGSSGGFGKWILNELLQIGEVDYVIQVVSGEKVGKLYTFEIFTKHDNILSGSKSAYYPVTLVDALSFIKENEGKYAITSVPCFSKAIRNICLNDSEMANKIKYVIGIICGHLKSTGFAESLAWQLDVEPKNLKGIEFRGKIEGLKANEKGVFAQSKSGEISRTVSSKKLLGGNWGYGFFKYKACDYCDDIVGETADISIGDAWLEGYMDDYQGNSVLIVRNNKIASIIENALKNNRVKLDEVNSNIVVKSQAGGIRHRREGLSYRLFRKIKNKEWVPKKRVAASNKLPKSRKKIYAVREILREASHTYFKKAKEKRDYNYFEKSMRKYLKKLEPGLISKIKFKLKNL